MKQVIYLVNGAIHSLKEILQSITPRSVLLVHDKDAYALSGAKAILTEILRPYQVCCYYEFEDNPKIKDVERGVALFQQQKYDVVIAVGGGSVLDMAKLIKIMAVQDASPSDIITQQKPIEHRGVHLVAIPTTAGTGSEATHFAVVYIDKTKYSVAHEYILPDIAIIDPELTHSLPARITATTGMDALSQAIESYWCINSTDESKAYAKEAIILVLDNLERAVHEPSPETRYAMSKAAYLAGRAINISKTTAPHAISYALTSHFGIPHGHAVGLSLGEFLVYNSQVDDHDVTDPHGVAYVRESIEEICEFFGEIDVFAARGQIRDLMHSIGLKTRLRNLGIVGDNNYNWIVDQVNLERLGNNPRQVTKENLLILLKSIT